MGIQEGNERLAMILWAGTVLIAGASWLIQRWRSDTASVPWVPIILSGFAIFHPALFMQGDGDCAGMKSGASQLILGTSVLLIFWHGMVAAVERGLSDPATATAETAPETDPK